MEEEKGSFGFYQVLYTIEMISSGFKVLAAMKSKSRQQNSPSAPSRMWLEPAWKVYTLKNMLSLQHIQTKLRCKMHNILLQLLGLHWLG